MVIRIGAILAGIALLASCVTAPAYPGWRTDTRIATTVQLTIGMSVDDVMQLEPSPSKINQSVDVSGQHLQMIWERPEANTVYSGSIIWAPYLYMYFDNGKLSGWQE